MTDMISKADLEHGAYYEGRCRHATVARWDANAERFRHWRTKFMDTYLEYIRHPEDDQVCDVFVPRLKIAPPERAIPLEEPHG